MEFFLRFFVLDLAMHSRSTTAYTIEYLYFVETRDHSVVDQYSGGHQIPSWMVIGSRDRKDSQLFQTILFAAPDAIGLLLGPVVVLANFNHKGTAYTTVVYFTYVIAAMHVVMWIHL